MPREIIMNEESKIFWKKFYLIFGQNGCSGWDALEKIGLATNTWEYPHNVLCPSEFPNYFILPRKKWGR